MKKLISLIAFSLMLVSCEKIEGQLNVTKEVKLKNSNGNTHLLKVGTYSADINPKTKKRITLRLNNDNDEKFEFNLPEGSRIPTNGTFSFKSKEIDQPVDLDGSVTSVTTNGEVRETNESCTYQMPETVCFPLPQGGMSCSVQYRTVMGYKWIRYYDRTTNKNVVLSIHAINETDESASFHGDINLVDRVVLNESMCR